MPRAASSAGHIPKLEPLLPRGLLFSSVAVPQVLPTAAPYSGSNSDSQSDAPLHINAVVSITCPLQQPASAFTDALGGLKERKKELRPWA